MKTRRNRQSTLLTRKMIRDSYKRIMDQLETVDMHTLLNCILVEAGVRTAMLVEGTSYLNTEGVRKYQLQHTQFPDAFKSHYNNPRSDYLKGIRAFRVKYRNEVYTLFEKQVAEFLHKYYPSLLYTITDGGILVHKHPLPTKYKNFKRFSPSGQEWRKGMRELGDLLDYPCSPTRQQHSGKLEMHIMATFNKFSPTQIFGNGGCSIQRVGEFLKIAKKYENALRNSIMGPFLGEVYIQIVNGY